MTRRFNPRIYGFHFKNPSECEAQIEITEECIREWLNKDPLTKILRIPPLTIEALCRIALAMSSFHKPSGYCYGMASLGVYYYNYPNNTPKGKRVYDLQLVDVYDKLKNWHESQRWSVTNILKKKKSNNFSFVCRGYRN
jgi:hypothetical protein